MPDFTSGFTQERDHWKQRAEAAEAEVARLRDDLRVERITTHVCASVDEDREQLQAEVERLRGALAEARVTVHQFQQEVGVDLLGLHENCGPDEVAGAVTGLRLSRDAWQESKVVLRSLAASIEAALQGDQ